MAAISCTSWIPVVGMSSRVSRGALAWRHRQMRKTSSCFRQIPTFVISLCILAYVGFFGARKRNEAHTSDSRRADQPTQLLCVYSLHFVQRRQRSKETILYPRGIPLHFLRKRKYVRHCKLPHKLNGRQFEAVDTRISKLQPERLSIEKTIGAKDPLSPFGGVSGHRAPYDYYFEPSSADAFKRRPAVK